MRIRSLVSSAALMGAMLGTSALVSLPAYAQKGTVMAPATGWAVKRIDNPMGSYCALARKFTQNTVLTMARNERLETSFALDFQRPVLDTARASAIVMDPGAGEQRRYQAKPVSNRAFVVKLGQDVKFFDAMEHTGLLRVEIDGTSFNFNVADLEAGQTKLDACVANMILPAGSGGGANAQSSPQVGSVQDEIQELRQEIADLRSQNQSLNAEMMVKAPATSAGLKTSDYEDVAALSAQVESLERNNAAINQRIQGAGGLGQAPADERLSALRAENAQLKSELQSVRVHADEGHVSALQQEIQSLQKQNNTLVDAMDSQTQGQGAVVGLKQQLSQLQQENGALNAQISSIREDVKRDFERQISSLEAENQRMQYASASAGDGDLIAQLRQQIAQMDRENEVLRQTSGDRVATLENELASRAAIAGRIRDLEAALEASKEQAIRIAELEQQLRAAQGNSAQVAELQQKLQAQQGLGARISELENALADSRQEVARVAQLEQELAALRVENAAQAKQLLEIGTSTAEVQQLKEENSKLQQKIAGFEAQDIQIEILNSRIRTLESENRTLTAQLDSLKAGNTQAVSAEAAALREENAQLKLEIATLQNQSTTQIAALQGEIAALKTKNAALEQSVSGDSVQGELQEVLALNATLKTEIEKKDEELRSLSRVQAHIREGGDEASIEDKVSDLQGKLASVTAASQDYEARTAQQQKRIDALLAENEALKSSLQNSPMRKSPASLEPSAGADDYDEQVYAQLGTQMNDASVVEEPEAEAPAADVLAMPEVEPEAKAGVGAEKMEEIQDLVAPSDEGELSGAAEEALNEAQKLEMEMMSAPPVVPEAPVEEPVVQDIPSLLDEVEAEPIEDGQVPAEVESADVPESAPIVEEVEQEVVAEPVPEPEPVVEAPAADPSVEVFASETSSPSVSDLIGRANITTANNVQKVPVPGDQANVAYQWSLGSIYGSAEQRDIANPAQFDDMVRAYIERTQSRCPGDFAVSPDQSRDYDGMRVDSYEVACVGGAVSSGASLLFFNEGGVFTAIAHEAPAAELGTAMDYRNQVLQVLNGRSK